MNIVDKVIENMKYEKNVNSKDMHSLSLAFLGDAIHSLYVRFALVNCADFKQKDLQKISSSIVCAKNQAKAFDLILPELNEQEIGVVKRARNAKTNNIAKNSSIEEYKKSTAFEALIGYLYLSDEVEKMDKFLSVANVVANEGLGGSSIC